MIKKIQNYLNPKKTGTEHTQVDNNEKEDTTDV